MSKTMLRNPIDYILTDCLPNELSIRYTHIHLYNYIINNVAIQSEIRTLREKNRTSYIKGDLLFEGITSVPLRYNVMKRNGQFRTISLMSPLSSLNAYLFVNLYESKILTNLGKSKYSIRKSVKNNNIYHKHTNKRITTYYSGKKKFPSTIEQKGDYFTVGPYNSLIDFQNSTEWFSNGVKYSYLASFDFSKCFDSIYSHSYKWFMTNNLVESKNFKNSHLFKTLDHMCQNINGKQTNGIIVGSEFSRMLAELLLQQIDEIVYHELNNLEIEYSKDYMLYRYVDDFYLFANNEQIIDKVISIVQTKSRQFNLTLNNEKSKINKLPNEHNAWFSDIDLLKSRVIDLFELDNEGNSVFSSKSFNKRFIHLKAHFLNLCGRYKENKQTITRYVLTIIDKNFLKTHENTNMFAKMSIDRICEYIEFIFFIQEFDLTFNTTSKVISILNSINDVKPLRGYYGLQDIINKYFESSVVEDYSDLQNLVLVLAQLDIQFPSKFEERMNQYILKGDNPILLAHLYLYYSESLYKNKFIDIINDNIRIRLDRIIDLDSALLYTEFWYVLIFYNFPKLAENNKSKIREIVNKSLINDCSNYSIIYKIIGKFIKENRMGFFRWYLINELTEISFKTENLSIFKKSY